MKVLITRPRSQADEFAAKLRSAGFEPVFFPVIEIRPLDNNAELDDALKRLNLYAWVVFTSVNAVQLVLGRLPSQETHPSFRTTGTADAPRVAAIGPRTALALQAHGITPDFIPEEYVAEAILPGLGDLRGQRVLLPRAEIARKALPEAIAAAGGSPHEIAVYRTMPAEVDPVGLAALRSGVDVITLTSPSTVENFLAITRENGLDALDLPNHPLFACIGPITEQAALEAGLANILTASEFTTDGLVERLSQIARR